MSIGKIYEAVLALDQERVKELVHQAIASGTDDINQILNEGLIAAMDEVGRRYSAGELFVPEMLVAAQAMKAGISELKPHLVQDRTREKGTIVIGTVQGDLHDIGKNLVAMLMESAGFEVIDLGVGVEVAEFIRVAREQEAAIIAMSALLTTTMPAMAEVVKAVKQQGLGIKTLVGGAPVTQSFADQIGADGYGEDAPGAVEAARRLIAG